MWLSIKEVSKLLKVHPNTLRRHETADGRWCVIMDFKFRVYRFGTDRASQRRYNEYEIMRIVEKLKQEA